MKKTTALAAAICLAAWAASAQPYAPTPPDQPARHDNLLFTQAQAPTEGTAAKAAAKTKKKSDAKSEKSDPKKASKKKKNAKKKAAPPPPS